MIALLGPITLLAALLVQVPAAQGSSTLLCKGFTQCAAAGYSSFGYGPTNYKKMWWRMYSGHNCTNYMAYRMIKAGMPVQRPWSGSGDARNWGVVFKSKTNQTPMVGSVAWWSSNHVAYVQRIIDANTIIISEDHYRGDFDWRKITRAGGGWPTGFIHLVDEAVRPTVPPTVTGTPQVDQTLALTPGAWTQTGATYKYQWLASGTAIVGAVAASYTPTPEQVGKTFAVKVTATKPGFRAGSSTSAVTVPAIPGRMSASGSPVVSGIAKVGAVLTASVPAVAPAPDALKYAWFADGKAIPGAVGTSITLKPEQLGKTIRFLARASRAGYDELRANSAETATVGPEKLTVTTEPVLTGNPYVGRPLTLTPGAVTPNAVTRYQWFADGVAIPGATSATYTPTLADPGVRLTLRVSYTRPGYTTVVRELQPKRVVRSIAKFRVRSLAHRSVTVTVLADGMTVVRGEVTLINRQGKKRTLKLIDGKATFSPDWIYAGERTFTIMYLGSYRVEARNKIVALEVR